MVKHGILYENRNFTSLIQEESPNKCVENLHTRINYIESKFEGSKTPRDKIPINPFNSWELDKMKTYEDYRLCLCGMKIKTVFYIKRNWNGKEYTCSIGSKCIERFFENLHPEAKRMLNESKRLTYDCPNCDKRILKINKKEHNSCRCGKYKKCFYSKCYSCFNKSKSRGRHHRPITVYT